MKNKIIIFLVLVWAAGSLSAQHLYHEFTVGAAGGVNGMIFNLNNLEQSNDIGYKPSFGGGLEIEYVLHFSNSWSFIVSTSAEYYGHRYDFTSLSESSVQRTAIPQYSEFILNTEIKDYSERYDAMFLKVPILFGYETPGEFTRFYCRLGASVSIPVMKNYNTSIGLLKTSGYRENEDWTMGDKYPYLGFGTQENVKIKGKANIGVGMDGHVEAGVKIPIRTASGVNFNLYAGAFWQMNILANDRGGDNMLVGYSKDNNRSTVINDHLLPTSITDTRYLTKDRMFLGGVVLRFGFDFGRKNVKMFMRK